MKGRTAKLPVCLDNIDRLLFNSLDPQPGINRTEDRFAITSKVMISGF